VTLLKIVRFPDSIYTYLFVSRKILKQDDAREVISLLKKEEWEYLSRTFELIK